MVKARGDNGIGGESDSKQYAYERLDRAMHERARLGMMTSLMAHPQGLYFPQLKAMCDLTDGNLKRHLDVLVTEGLVSVEKEPCGNRVQTRCRMLPEGKRRFLEYLSELRRVLADAAAATELAELKGSKGPLAIGRPRPVRDT
jgi:DNA-binding MarR family transcriptional regulator